MHTLSTHDHIYNSTKLLTVLISITLFTAFGAAGTYTVDQSSTDNPNSIGSVLLPVTHSFGQSSVTRRYDRTDNQVVLDIDTSLSCNYPDQGFANVYIDNDNDGTVDYQISNSVCTVSEMALWQYDNGQWTAVWTESNSVDTTEIPNTGIEIDEDNMVFEIPVDSSAYATGSSFKYSIHTDNTDDSNNYASGDAAWKKVDSSEFSTVRAHGASSGDTVEVAPGTYEESATNGHAVELLKDGLTLESTGSADNTVIKGGSDQWTTIHVDANDVTVDGFTIKTSGFSSNYESAFGVRVIDDSDNFVLKNSILKDISAPARATGVAIYTDAVDFSGTSIEGAKILNNEIRNIYTTTKSPSTAHYSESKAKGISLNGDVRNAEVRDNTVQDIGGSNTVKTRGLSIVEGNVGPTNFKVTGNTFDDIKSGMVGGSKVEGPATVFIGGYSDLGNDHVMSNNKFLDGIVRNCCGSSQPTLNAPHNYWGDQTGPERKTSSGVWVGSGTILGGNVAWRPYSPTLEALNAGNAFNSHGEYLQSFDTDTDTNTQVSDSHIRDVAQQVVQPDTTVSDEHIRGLIQVETNHLVTSSELDGELSTIEQQEETIEAQQERIAELESQVEDMEDTLNQTLRVMEAQGQAEVERGPSGMSISSPTGSGGLGSLLSGLFG